MHTKLLQFYSFSESIFENTYQISTNLLVTAKIVLAFEKKIFATDKFVETKEVEKAGFVVLLSYPYLKANT